MNKKNLNDEDTQNENKLPFNGITEKVNSNNNNGGNNNNPSSLNEKIENIFKEIGEFGRYQLLIFILVGIISFVPAIVGYSFGFYAATPSHRCAIPGLANDTYEIANEQHSDLVKKYIPLATSSIKEDYDNCHLKLMNSTSSFNLTKCSKWVYSKKYFEKTIITEWNLVCDDAPVRSLYSTLYFIGLFGVVFNGILSDRFGRKKASYFYLSLNALLNISLTILLMIPDNESDIVNSQRIKKILFGIIRFLCGVASNVYSIAVVLAIELCGASKRVTANNFIYYLYILGEVVVVLFAYLIRDFRYLYAAFTLLMTLFLFYFWYVPESPRWLMAKNLNNEAYKVFKRIAQSNKKSEDNLELLESIKEHKITTTNNRRLHCGDHDDLPMKVLSATNEQNKKFNSSNNNLCQKPALTSVNSTNYNNNNNNNPLTFVETIKLFFKSKKLLIRSCILLTNWLTNTLVYYGISFNTTELIGDPYLNFFLSILVEFVAILACQFTLERFGRKVPYSINMALAGAALLCVQFAPEKIPQIVTILALVAKFCISFTYNSIYIITAELHPTVIRNSSVSICQTFARFGGVIAPNIQLLGNIYWFPLPFIIYGIFSTISAISFVVLMPETKNLKLPDTIDDFI